MTTNHIDRLDPALLRPGRCDRKFLLDYANDQQILDIYQSFYAFEFLKTTLFS